MFSPSTTASINCSVSGPEFSLLAVALDAPKPSSRRFRRLPSGWDSSFSALLSASSVVIENRVSVPLLHVQAFAPSKELLCPRLTSANSSHHLSMTVVRDKLTDLPG